MAAAAFPSSPPPVLLLLLMGLPAAGKTTLSLALKDFLLHHTEDPLLPAVPLSVHLITFDRFTSPATLQQPLLQQQQQQQQEQQQEQEQSSPFDRQQWKRGRAAALDSLQKLLERLCCPGENEEEKVERGEEQQEAILKKQHVFTRHVIIVDDTMHLRSMREQVFKLCCQYQAAYLLLFVNSPLSLALRRNASRSTPHRVPPDTIHRMAAALDVPNASRHACDRSFLEVAPDDGDDVAGGSVDVCSEEGGDVSKEGDDVSRQGHDVGGSGDDVSNFKNQKQMQRIWTAMRVAWREAAQIPLQAGVREEKKKTPPSAIHVVDLKMKRLISSLMSTLAATRRLAYCQLDAHSKELSRLRSEHLERFRRFDLNQSVDDSWPRRSSSSIYDADSGGMTCTLGLSSPQLSDFLETFLDACLSCTLNMYLQENEIVEWKTEAFQQIH